MKNKAKKPYSACSLNSRLMMTYKVVKMKESSEEYTLSESVWEPSRGLCLGNFRYFLKNERGEGSPHSAKTILSS